MIEVKPLRYQSQGGHYGGIYACAKPNPKKGIVLFHGHGEDDSRGFRPGAEQHLETLVKEIADAQDWAVAGISTRGYGSSWSETQQMDWVSEITQQAAKDGVEEFKEKVGLKDEQLFLWGQSEGGQIAMLLAAKYLPNVAGVISYNGVLDHAEFVRTNHDSERIIRSHESKRIFPKAYPFRSPINYVGQIKCPVFIWYSHEDVLPVVRPDIPIEFAKALRKTNPRVVALSFEGGHAPWYSNLTEAHSRGPGIGYEYKNDWMWRDYFLPFIKKADPATFRQVLEIHDPLGDVFAPDLAKILKPISDESSSRASLGMQLLPGQQNRTTRAKKREVLPAQIRRATAEALARCVREDQMMLALSQLKATFDDGGKDFFFYVLERNDIPPERKVSLVEAFTDVRHFQQGEETIYQLLNPSEFRCLFTERREVAPSRYGLGHWPYPPEVGDALLASDKVGRFLFRDSQGQIWVKSMKKVEEL